MHPSVIATQWRDVDNRIQALRSIRIQTTHKPKPCKGGIININVSPPISPFGQLYNRIIDQY